MKKHALILQAIALGCLMLFSSLPISAQSYRIGFIADFEKAPELIGFCQQITQSIQKTVGASAVLTLDEQHIRSANWSLEQAVEEIDSLEKSCDLLLLLGSVSMKASLSRDSFNIPTLGLGVFSPQIQEIPFTDKGTSGVENFTYILTAMDFEAQLDRFHQMVDFQHLGLLFDERTAQSLNATQALKSISDLGQKFQAEISPIPLSANPETSLEAMPEGVDAVFLATPYELQGEQVARLAQEIAKRDLPSFSLSKPHVDQGIMACWSDDNGFEQIIRRLGILVDDVVRGEKLADLSVALNQKQELYLNMATVREIDFHPTFELLFTANLIGEPKSDDTRVYSLKEIIALGLEQNLDIQLSNQDVVNAGLEVKQAQSQYLPDADVSVSGAQIDKGRTSAFLGQSESTLSGNASLSQLIFSEQASANIRIQRYLQEAQNEAYQQAILDVLLDCYTAYLNVLQAKTNVLIQQENLSSSKTNLELARLRSDLGASSNADVYRWEGEVATAQQNTIEAQTNLLTAQFQLNNLLNNQLEEGYEIEDIGLEDELFRQFQENDWVDYIKGPYELGIVSRFLIQEAQQNFPSKKQLNANEKLLERTQLMNKRLFYTPTVAAQAQTDQTFWRGGEGSTANPDQPFNNNTWSLGLSISYPLFDGNRRRLNQQQTSVDQAQLQLQKRQLDQNLDLQVRSNTLSLLNASTDIYYSNISRQNMARNFELVQNNYQQGQVSIVQLIDAQQASLNAKQAYAISVYNFIQANIRVEYSIGFFSMLASEEALQAFDTRLKEYFLLNKE
ncbi:MAG: TolC family protein [Bacteroidota bacterium]